MISDIYGVTCKVHISSMQADDSLRGPSVAQTLGETDADASTTCRRSSQITDTKYPDKEFPESRSTIDTDPLEHVFRGGSCRGSKVKQRAGTPHPAGAIQMQ